jgi:hypothetical protein
MTKTLSLKNVKKSPPEINNNLLLQIMEDLNTFTEIYVISAEFNLLRSKLRLLHQSMPKSDLKSVVRGLLTFLKRWPKKRIWLKISTILQRFMKDYEINSLKKIRIIEANRFVGHSNILTAFKIETNLPIKKE